MYSGGNISPFETEQKRCLFGMRVYGKGENIFAYFHPVSGRNTIRDGKLIPFWKTLIQSCKYCKWVFRRPFYQSMSQIDVLGW